MDGKRPGTFYINGNDPHRTPSYILPALALHEANPGHHLQGSRLLETPNLPKFRLLMEDRKYSEMPTHFPMHTAYTEVNLIQLRRTEQVLFDDIHSSSIINLEYLKRRETITGLGPVLRIPRTRDGGLHRPVREIRSLLAGDAQSLSVGC